MLVSGVCVCMRMNVHHSCGEGLQRAARLPHSPASCEAKPWDKPVTEVCRQATVHLCPVSLEAWSLSLQPHSQPLWVPLATW